MEINMTEALFPSLKKILETSTEQSIDTDFTLPDYYPEVSKVMKCLTEVNILSKQIKDGAVSIGGQAVFTLLYSDPEKTLNSFTHICPFTKTVDAKIDNDKTNICVLSRINYMNSKATAPRKLEIHGSLGLNIAVSGMSSDRILTDADGEGIYTKIMPVSYSEPIGMVSKSIFIEDDINVGQNKPSIGKIIRSNASVKVTECKFISSKAVVKGELCVEMLYTPAQQGKSVLLTEQHGFSQIIDCDEINENTECDVNAEVISLELHPKTSLDGEVKSVNFEAKVSFDIMPYVNAEGRVISDAFSGQYSADIVYTDIPLERLSEKIDENYVCKKTLDFTDGTLEEVCDLWCNSNIDYTSCENGDIVLKGTVLINVIGFNSDGEPVFYERPVDYEYRYALDTEIKNARCCPYASIIAVNHSQSSTGSLDVAVELAIKITVFSTETVRVVSQINIDEKTTVCKDCETAVILYFAENESVWQIAKKYNTSPQKICEANSVDGYDTQCNKIMLIPNV